MIVVGDIHGEISQVETLIKTIGFTEDQYLFLGDYIGRGASSKEVVDCLVNLSKTNKAIFLCGNHEYYFLDYIKTGNLIDIIDQGGFQTLKSYLKNPHGNVLDQLRKSISIDHEIFFSSLKTYWETDDYFFSHSGINPKNIEDRSFESLVLSNHNLLNHPNEYLKMIVCGHYIQRDFTPKIKNNILFVDTGCGTIGGPLTAVILPDFQFIQVFPDLSIIEGKLVFQN